MSKIPTDIERSLGMNISRICPFNIAKNNSENHCAHYVSHIMGYELPGATCKNATWADKQKPAKGATIRVNDLFGAVPVTGPLANKPAALTECLIELYLMLMHGIDSPLVSQTNPNIKTFHDLRQI
ncbi:hypothetical protein sS8_0225 [Methylocaldum marinum]|uniref:Uncharacterized protein n=1 Tax=Methylocaldum marinum TaxID=1432792 RepID=A0A286P3H1_9GAMM|nr:hypothetical protein [Methylocaldum marinum]BBA32193.1 hypothetical protein sS8_0225 [Methylocaldum marinum]